MIDDQLSLNLTVNNAEFISQRPYGVKILEGLFKSSTKDVESQHNMDQTINLSIGMPTKTNIDDEIGGNTKNIFNNSALNFSNIYPAKSKNSPRGNIAVENVLSEVSIELESEKNEFKQYQPETVAVESNVFENSNCLNINNLTPSKPFIESNVSIMNETKADTIVTQAFMSEKAKEKYEYYSSIAASIDFRSIEQHVLDVIDKKELKLRACKDWIEKKKGTCFKVTLREQIKGKDRCQEILEEIVFDSDPEDFLHYFFFSSYEERKSWDHHAQQFDILYAFEKDGTKYIFFRQCTKKVFIIKAREYVYCVALRKLETGDLIYAMQSYDDKNCSFDATIERGRFELGGGYVKFGEDRQISMTNKS